MKKVTIIIPTYKRSTYLERAIKSVLNQTYKNIEIIVVDDNDEDSIYRTKNELLMKKYSEFENIIYLKHKKNKNGAAARNTGLKKATGDYTTFLDDDDYFFPTRIEKLVELLEKNPNYSFVCSSVIVKNKNKVQNVITPTVSGNLQEELLKQNSFFGTGSNIFLKKEMVEKIGFFDERFLRHQDIEYMVRFFEYGKAIFLEEPLVVKCNDDLINKPNYEKMIKTKELFFDKFKKEISKFDVNNIYYVNYLEILNCCLLNKEQFNYIYLKLSKYGKVSFLLKIKYFIKKLLKTKFKFVYIALIYFKSLKYKEIRKQTTAYEKLLSNDIINY